MNKDVIFILDDHELIINDTSNLLEPYPRFKIIIRINDCLAMYNTTSDL